MSAQLSIFEALSARDRMLEAIAQSPKQQVYLRFVRPIARELARRNGCVAVDDVREELCRRDLPLPAELGIDARVFGTLFRGKEFVAIAQRPTRCAERIARAGVGASYVTVYRLAEVA